MKKYILVIFLVLSIANKCHSNESNIQINEKGKIQNIQFNKISYNNGLNILALIVADDLYKLAKKWASDGKHKESITLLTSANYLDITNIESLEYAATLKKKFITDESSRAKIFKDFMNEAKAGMKNTNEIHKIQVEMSLVIISQAKSLYPQESKEYHQAQELEDKIKIKKMSADELGQIAKKMISEAEIAYKNGDIAKAINQYSMAYYASKEVTPIIKIAGIVQDQL